MERDPALQLLRIVEAYHAIQERVENVQKDTAERRKLENAMKTLDNLRHAETRKDNLVLGR